MSDLEDRLLSAHARGNIALLAELYARAADHASTAQAAGFYLTQAHVFALEAGLAEAAVLRARLIEMGRETAL